MLVIYWFCNNICFIFSLDGVCTSDDLWSPQNHRAMQIVLTCAVSCFNQGLRCITECTPPKMLMEGLSSSACINCGKEATACFTRSCTECENITQHLVEQTLNRDIHADDYQDCVKCLMKSCMAKITRCLSLIHI